MVLHQLVSRLPVDLSDDPIFSFQQIIVNFSLWTLWFHYSFPLQQLLLDFDLVRRSPLLLVLCSYLFSSIVELANFECALLFFFLLQRYFICFS